jgi:hypothetical protein
MYREIKHTKPPLTVGQLSDLLSQSTGSERDRIVVLRIEDADGNVETHLITDPSLYCKDGYDCEGKDRRVLKIEFPYREP